MNGTCKGSRGSRHRPVHCSYSALLPGRGGAGTGAGRDDYATMRIYEKDLTPKVFFRKFEIRLSYELNLINIGYSVALTAHFI